MDSDPEDSRPPTSYSTIEHDLSEITSLPSSAPSSDLPPNSTSTQSNSTQQPQQVKPSLHHFADFLFQSRQLDSSQITQQPHQRAPIAALPMASSAQRQQEQFRHYIFENCSSNQLNLTNQNLGSNSILALMKYLLRPQGEGQFNHSTVKFLNLSQNNLQNYGTFEIVRCLIESDLSKCIPQQNQNEIASTSSTNSATNSSSVSNEIKNFKNFPMLQILNLSHNGISNKGCLELARLIENNPPLLSLELGSLLQTECKGNKFDGPHSARLFQALSKNYKLLHLGLSDCLTEPQLPIQTLCKLLAPKDFSVMNNTLASVRIEKCNLPDTEGIALFEALSQNNSLRHLWLSSNKLTSAIKQSLANCLQHNKNMVGLRLGSNALLSETVNFVMPSLLNNNNLLILDLSNTQLDDQSSSALSQLLSSQTLTSLNLSNNLFTQQGMSLISQGFQSNQVLTSLNLRGNDCGSSLLPLCEGLRTNSSLLSLDLTSTKTNDDVAISLFVSLGSNNQCTLMKLKLSDNFITSLSGEVLLNNAMRNHTLCHLELSGNQMDHVRLRRLIQVTERNRQERQEIEPKRLRKEIARMRGEQVALRKAEMQLKQYQDQTEDVRNRIRRLEVEKRQSSMSTCAGSTL